VAGPGRQSRRDLGITALVEGFFAAAWFGWGSGAAPAAWRSALTVGSVLALVMALTGAFVGLRSPASTAVMREPGVSRRYGIITGAEFATAALGAVVLAVLGQAEFIAAWVCATVGVHFLPLASVLRDRLLVPLGLLLCAVAVAAVAAGAATAVASSAVTGLGAGTALLVFGAIAVIKAVRTPRRAAGGPV
jgi:hypothetical protein